MRISDWSSDVCSSDLLAPSRRFRLCGGGFGLVRFGGRARLRRALGGGLRSLLRLGGRGRFRRGRALGACGLAFRRLFSTPSLACRRALSGGSGRRLPPNTGVKGNTVAVRVHLGGWTSP